MRKYCIKCNIPFELNTNNFYFINCKNTFINICRNCQKNKLTNDRILREEKAKSLGYKSEHDFKMRTNENFKKYRESERLKFLTKKSDAIRNKTKIDLLTDSYIIGLIKGVPKNKITPELIEIYRLNVKLKREIRNAR